MSFIKITVSTFLLLAVGYISIYAQTADGRTTKVITTAVPFLGITPDARSAGLGDAGTALTGDVNAIYWNPGRLAMSQKDYGGSASITPWLRNLGVTDVYLGHFAGFYKPRKQDAIGISLTYFNLGVINLTDITGNPQGNLNPNEFAVSGAYSRQLSRHLSVGVNAKFFYSNLVGSFSNNTDGSSSRPARSVAVDMGMFYNKDIALGGTPANLAFGLAIANFGPKISYSNNNRRDFIPTVLRLGTALTKELDPYNKVTFTLDLSKQLVPTPVLVNDSLVPAEEQFMSGVIQSLYKAPGGGKEKLQEIMMGGGIEYWYDNLFALRGGYFHENKEKGNRNYFTAGLGIRYQTFGLDFAYLLPVQSNHPLAETLRFTLLFTFDKPVAEQESVTDDKK